MAFRVLETSVTHELGTVSVIASYLNIQFFSPMFAGSFRMYLSNLNFYKHEYYINIYLRSLIMHLSVDLCPLCAL